MYTIFYRLAIYCNKSNDAQVSVYGKESEYFADIQAAKQPKPDIILNIDVEEEGGEVDLKEKVKTYGSMLGNKVTKSILAYHNKTNEQIAVDDMGNRSIIYGQIYHSLFPASTIHD
jgi:hypothetical protein